MNSVRFNPVIDEFPIPKRATTIKKVPGDVAAVGKLGSDVKNFESEIKYKSTEELKDLLKRQNNILDNQRLVATLADKGSKVHHRKEQLEVSVSQINFLMVTS